MSGLLSSSASGRASPDALVAAACHYRTVNLPILVIGPADSVPVLAIGLVTKDFKVSDVRQHYYPNQDFEGKQISRLRGTICPRLVNSRLSFPYRITERLPVVQEEQLTYRNEPLAEPLPKPPNHIAKR